MSKTKLNRRLEDLFADVPREDTKAHPRKRPPRITGLLTPAGAAPPAPAPKPSQAKSLAYESAGATDRRADPNAPSDVISLAFQPDPSTWATLRVVDEGASHVWSTEEHLLVKQVADQLSLALENARLFQETRRAQERLQVQNERLSAAAEIGRLVTSTLDLDTIFGRTVNLLGERFGYSHAAVFLVEQGGTTVVLREGTGNAGAEMKARAHSLPINLKSLLGRVTSTGEAAVVNDTRTEQDYRHNPLLPETRAEAAIPLRVGNRIIGALDIHSATSNAFTPEDLSVLQILADQVAIAIDNARSYQLAQQAVREMRELDRVKTQFLANMSHELRTPLNSIIGFSRVILKGIDGPISDLQRQDLTAIYNSGQHLLGLINDMLDLAKIEAGKMDMAFEETDIAEIITAVMSTASGLVKDKPIRLTQKVPEVLPTVRADPIRVRQVLLNLMSNAAKFTEQGEIIVDAQTQQDSAGLQEVIVRVTDTGPGIAQEDQAKLFQAFSQVDDSPTRRTGGSGLGLSISQQLIQLQGGRIGVQSEVGQGSTFYFTLPVYATAPETATTSEGRVVMAVDDDPQVIRLYERYLEPQGYHVIGVTDPTKARERAIQLKPFAITLDIMMPGKDGWSVLTELKEDSETRNIPVIVCSILEQQERGFSLGAADYVLKPILGDSLLNSLNRLNKDRLIREVLLVDDDPADLRMMEKLFQNQRDYRLILAHSGEDALKVLNDHAPDAVILDLFMPGLDGFQLLERMRERPELRHMPVIVVSGGDLTPEQRSQLTEFGHRLIGKSTLSEAELFDTVQRALQRVRPKA
ncbi:MAG TPA: response regulator [Anaerolineales bacterium]|nr:response regulator [Anaerolineales bacterium]